MTLNLDFHLPPSRPPLGRVVSPPPESNSTASHLLRENHTRFHVYFRNVAGHNHIAHAVLTTLALGGTPEDLHRAYEEYVFLQRPLRAVDWAVVREMQRSEKAFRANMQQQDMYPNYLALFTGEIEAQQGDWQAVVTKHCFARTELADFMFAQLFEGLYHPFIHMGLGVEFGLAGVVAEGLAHTASHDPMRVWPFFVMAEKLAAAEKGKGKERRPLVELYGEVRASSTLRNAPRAADGPWRLRDGIIGQVLEEMAQVAAQFWVEPTEEDVERATAEMISCAAWACGAAEGPRGQRRIDFFLMHCVTSSLVVTAMARQPWIKIADKARLVEWKTRLDLAWYAASAAPVLRGENVVGYEPTLSKGLGWEALYKTAREQHDDGHITKYMRAIKNGEDATARYEREPNAANFLPVRGESWLRLAQFCHDTTTGPLKAEDKWVFGIGYDEMWGTVPAFV